MLIFFHLIHMFVLYQLKILLSSKTFYYQLSYLQKYIIKISIKLLYIQ
jgi:hypothetical protein